MKTERRHDLETNQLAAWIGDVVERARPHAHLVLIGLGGVLVVLLAASFFSRRWQARSSAAWLALTTANTPSELAAVGNDYPDSPAGSWGTLRSADSEFSQGMRRLFSNREDALVNLRAAQRAYEKLAGKSADSPLVDQRASFGLARSYEAMGETEEAIQAYQSLVDRYPEGLFVDQASARIEALKDPKTGEFYSWLEQQVAGSSGDVSSEDPPSPSEEDEPSSALEQTLDEIKPEATREESEPSDDGKTPQPDAVEQEATEPTSPPETENAPSADVPTKNEEPTPSVDEEPAATDGKTTPPSDER